MIAKKRFSWLVNTGYNIAIVLVFLFIWEVVARYVDWDYFPGSIKVLNRLWELFLHGDAWGISIWIHIVDSLFRVFGGFIMAFAFGLSIGLVMGLKRTTYLGTRSVVEPFRYIPPIAWVPLAIILFHGYFRYVFIIFIGAFWQVWWNTIASVIRISPLYIDVVRIHGANRWYALRHIVLPSIMPLVYAGLRNGMGVGWMCIIAAEIIGGGLTGLGIMIWRHAEIIDIPAILAAMIIIGVLGFIINDIFVMAERRFFKYRFLVPAM